MSLKQNVPDEGSKYEFLCHFSVSTFANNLTAQNQNCLNAFSTCRKYQDESGSVISSCSQNPAALASKLKGLTENNALVTKAQSALGTVTSRALQGGKQTAGSTCTDLINITEDMVDAMNVSSFFHTLDLTFFMQQKFLIC